MSEDLDYQYEEFDYIGRDGRRHQHSLTLRRLRTGDRDEWHVCDFEQVFDHGCLNSTDESHYEYFDDAESASAYYDALCQRYTQREQDDPLNTQPDFTFVKGRK
jgi:hypothetical protein